MQAVELAPPNIFEVSRRLARELVDLAARLEGRAIPLIEYHRSFLHRERGGPWRDCGPHLRIGSGSPADVPARFRRWFLGAAYAIAIPEGIWRGTQERLIDFDAQGLTIVLKLKWDGPGVRPPPLVDVSFSDASRFTLSPRMAALLVEAYEANGRTLVPILVYADRRARRTMGGPAVDSGSGFELGFVSLYLIPPERVGTIRGVPYALKIPDRMVEERAAHVLDCPDGGSAIVLR